MKNTDESPPLWFSEYYGVFKPQHELPFVDFLLDKDVPLYIDSYAITRSKDEWGEKCHEAITSYFQCLLDAAKGGDSIKLNRLIENKLTEPKQIYLGVAKKARKGVGLGPSQEKQLVEALFQSTALKTGFIQDIQELELHIDSLGFDKISDLVGNIIKGHLANYTTDICHQYGIEVTPCAISYFWDSSSETWSYGHFDLPVRDKFEYILVPKNFVRRKDDLVNHGTFYRRHMHEFFLAELRSASASLTATLQSASPRVTQKDLQKYSQYALNKRNVSRFIMEHPDLMKLYREDLMADTHPIDPAIISGKAEKDNENIYQNLKILDTLPYGAEFANKYHLTIFELLKYIFDWCFRNFEKEYDMDQGRGRIDIICDNYATDGLFGQLVIDMNATSVPIECKNYASELENSEFNQLSDRLGKRSSRLGFLFCRRTIKLENVAKHTIYRWLREEKCIIVFNDDEVKKMADFRIKGNFKSIEAYIQKKVRDIKFASKDAQKE